MRNHLTKPHRFFRYLTANNASGSRDLQATGELGESNTMVSLGEKAPCMGTNPFHLTSPHRNPERGSLGRSICLD